MSIKPLRKVKGMQRQTADSLEFFLLSGDRFNNTLQGTLEPTSCYHNSYHICDKGVQKR